MRGIFNKAPKLPTQCIQNMMSLSHDISDAYDTENSVSTVNFLSVMKISF